MQPKNDRCDPSMNAKKEEVFDVFVYRNTVLRLPHMPLGDVVKKPIETIFVLSADI
jgi:hypothetical protein